MKYPAVLGLRIQSNLINLALLSLIGSLHFFTQINKKFHENHI